MWHYDNIAPDPSHVTSYHMAPTYHVTSDGYLIRAVNYKHMLNQLRADLKKEDGEKIDQDVNSIKFTDGKQKRVSERERERGGGLTSLEGRWRISASDKRGNK